MSSFRNGIVFIAWNYYRSNRPSKNGCFCMNYVPIDSNRSLVRIRTGFFVLFSVFKKRMTLRKELKLQPGGALRPVL